MCNSLIPLSILIQHTQSAANLWSATDNSWHRLPCISCSVAAAGFRPGDSQSVAMKWERQQPWCVGAVFTGLLRLISDLQGLNCTVSNHLPWDAPDLW